MCHIAWQASTICDGDIIACADPAFVLGVKTVKARLRQSGPYIRQSRLDTRQSRPNIRQSRPEMPLNPFKLSPFRLDRLASLDSLRRGEHRPRRPCFRAWSYMAHMRQSRPDYVWHIQDSQGQILAMSDSQGQNIRQSRPEYGTYKTVKARFQPWLSGKRP